MTKFTDFTGLRIQKAAKILGSYKEGDALLKAYENDLVKSEGSRGGKVVGHTKSGKAIYENPNHPDHKHFTEQDHEDARHTHMNEEVTHRNMQERDEAAATHGRAADKVARNKGDKGHKEDTLEAHKKRGFDESKGDEDITGKDEKLKKAFETIGFDPEDLKKKI